MPHKILFKFATRNRPEKFFQGLNNILQNLANKVDYMILVSIDKDDPKMYNKKILGQLEPYMDQHNIKLFVGTSKNKIDAINRDVNEVDYDWDILINFSDDMRFQVVGFDNTIRDKMQLHFPDTDGNLYFNDGFIGDKISTMSIIGRSYYNRFGYIYNPIYKSLFCDNEYTVIAKKLQKIQYYNEVLYKHEHPANVGGVADELLLHTESFYEEDGETYKKREKMNFGL